MIVHFFSWCGCAETKATVTFHESTLKFKQLKSVWQQTDSNSKNKDCIFADDFLFIFCIVYCSINNICAEVCVSLDLLWWEALSHRELNTGVQVQFLNSSTWDFCFSCKKTKNDPKHFISVRLAALVGAHCVVNHPWLSDNGVKSTMFSF